MRFVLPEYVSGGGAGCATYFSRRDKVKHVMLPLKKKISSFILFPEELKDMKEDVVGIPRRQPVEFRFPQVHTGSKRLVREGRCGEYPVAGLNPDA